MPDLAVVVAGRMWGRGPINVPSAVLSRLVAMETVRVTAAPPLATAPPPGTGSALFDWTADPTAGVTEYLVIVGTTPGGSQIGSYRTGSTEPNYWLTLPTGTYYARAQSVLTWPTLGATSNEVAFTIG